LTKLKRRGIMRGHMKLWIIIAAIALGFWILGGDDKKGGTYSPSPAYSAPSYSPSDSPSYTPAYSRRSPDLSDREDGEFDCTVENVSRGNGPYSLTCEKDGDDITINFPNGGYITVDSDGFHSERGEQWEVEVD
jgi:hypothetical protein